MDVRELNLIPIRSTQHERFKEGRLLNPKLNKYYAYCLSFSSSGNIAMSCRNDSGRNFIDMYSTFDFNSAGIPTLSFSKEFKQLSSKGVFRYVAFLRSDSCEIVMCSDNLIEICDPMNNSKLLRSRALHGIVRCLVVKEEVGEIFVGVFNSHDVLVLNYDLQITKKIVLKGIDDGDYPWDMTVTKDNLFVCIDGRNNRALSFRDSDGVISREFASTLPKYIRAWSIAVSEEMGFVAVLWDHSVFFYPVHDSKPILVVKKLAYRIRISDRLGMMLTGSLGGNIELYDLAELLTYDDMKVAVVSLLKKEDCVTLSNDIGLRNARKKSILNSDNPGKALIVALEGEGIIKPSDVDKLADALVNSKTSSSCDVVVDIYRKTQHLFKTKREETKPESGDEEPKALTREEQKGKYAFDVGKTLSTQELERLETELDHTRKTLQSLQFTHEQSIEEVKILTRELEQTKKTLEKTRQQSNQEIVRLTKELEETREILKPSKEESTKEVDALSRELDQSPLLLQESESLTKGLLETRNAATGAASYLNSEKAETSLLGAEFGRLIVGIADSLTLDQSLQLAMLFNLPSSVSDALCRVSIYQSPGLKFLEEIRNRDIINMYDITNLQKAFTVLKMENVKQNLLNPYQQQVQEELHELHKVKEMLKWEDVTQLNAQNEKTSFCQTEARTIPPEKDPTKEFDESTPTKTMNQPSEIEIDDRLPSLRNIYHHPIYIEHIISRKGGTMHLAGASLTVPPDAFLQSHVIGLSVTNGASLLLPKKVDKDRITPIIKLEPLGLMLQKPLQLTIPHSAFIPEPESMDVIIYSGQISSNTEDVLDIIGWTEERSLSRHLTGRTITVDIQRLCYFSASLVSQSSQPSFYIVRAVPFVDGVRNDDDDIILTVCFCSDNESEYSMLLSDYQRKLPFEQYSTVNLCQHSEIDDKDKDVLNLTISSLNNSYVPDKSQEEKDFAVAHVLAASRVSHQFRLKRNQQESSDVVDLMLTLTQAGNKLAEMFLKTRIKDLKISQKSEDLLLDSLCPAFKLYEDLKWNVSSMLENLHCRNLATYFELSPAEVERVENDSFPGKMLMKILDEREKIMPQKMIDLFQGLKACHLDKIARLVSEYIDVNSKEFQEIQKNKEKTNNDISKDVPNKQKIRVRSSQSNQSVQTTISSSCITCGLHVKTLTNEGYAEKEAVEALDICQNKLRLARKVLQCIGDQRALLPNINFLLYKEQYIDENGGEITLREANVDLLVPVGAVSKGSIVSIMTMTSKHIAVPSDGKSPQLTPVIMCGQEGVIPNKPITLRIPHCASETEGINSTDMYLGFSSKGDERQWRKRRQHEPCPLLKNDHFEVLVQEFCTISLHVATDNNKRLGKRLRALPLITRIVNPSDDLTVTLWIYNDDEVEHMHLLHEEITVGGKIKLHDFKRFTLNGSRKDKEVHIRSGNNNITPYPNANIKGFSSTALWYNTRRRAEFYFQNKQGVHDIVFRLRLYTRQFLRSSDDLQFDLKVTLSELLQEHRKSTSALLKIQEPQPAMEKSFYELIGNLSGKIGMESCSEIAGIFGLSSRFRARLNESSEPGNVLLDQLIHDQLISAAAVSALDVALTITGNECLAEDVKEYRRRNATFATTITASL